MRRWCLLLLCLVFASGCSVPTVKNVALDNRLIDDLPTIPSLMHVQIIRGDEQKFSGLIALKNIDQGVYFGLLDATGITLLEAKVFIGKPVEIIRAVGPVADSNLPGYLADTLRNIFLVEPESRPCAASGLMKLCHEDLLSGGAKDLQFGPLTLWRFEEIQKTGDAKTIWNYSQPLFGVRIVFKQLG